MIIYVPLKNISAGEGLQILGLCSALRAFEQWGIFIVPHLLWHSASMFFRSHSKDRPNQSPLTTHMEMWRTYSNLDPHRVWLDVIVLHCQSLMGMMKFALSIFTCFNRYMHTSLHSKFSLNSYCFQQLQLIGVRLWLLITKSFNFCIANLNNYICVIIQYTRNSFTIWHMVQGKSRPM